MSNIKLAIVYYSASGVNYQLATWAEEAAIAIGAEVRLVKVEETLPQAAIESNPHWQAHAEAAKNIPVATSDDLAWADAILFSGPTRFGTMAAQMKNFIDKQGGLWAQGKLANKAVSAMTSAQNPHGGQEATILSLYTSMMHWGAVIVAPGYTDAAIFKAGGNPYGTSVTQGQDGKPVEDAKDAVAHQAKRLVEVASWIKKGRA